MKQRLTGRGVVAHRATACGWTQHAQPSSPALRLHTLSRTKGDFNKHVYRCIRGPVTSHQHRHRTRDLCVRSAAIPADDGSFQLQFQNPYRFALPRINPAVLSTLATVVTVMLSGVANRILYRMALVPMKDYVFFLAQFQTFGYVAVYCTILCLRKRAGKVTKDMLENLPTGKFMVVGACEALAQVLLMMGAAQLPGAVLPLVSQSILVWNMAMSTLLLGARVRIEQVLGVGLVIGGVAMATWASGGGCDMIVCDKGAIGICLISFLFPSLGQIVKEKIFAEAQQRLGKGRQLDLFVVNSYGSATQALFVVLLLPFLTALRGIPLSTLPSYLQRGSQCFFGLAPSCGADCSGAPLLPALYVASNLIFNISALNLLRSQGSVSLSLCMAFLVPLTIWAFSLPIPYLDTAVLGPNFLGGTLVLMAGLTLFNLEHYSKRLENLFPIPRIS